MDYAGPGVDGIGPFSVEWQMFEIISALPGLEQAGFDKAFAQGCILRLVQSAIFC